jgi:glucose-6-phosphate-specific signal transduction histidine kinase
MVSVINDVRVAASRGHSAGLGLQGLRERLDAVGGHLYAGATTDGRFRLTVDIPTL